MQINLSKLRDVKMPTVGDGGIIQFYVPNDFPGTDYLAPGQRKTYHSGIQVESKQGLYMVVYNSHPLNVCFESGASVKFIPQGEEITFTAVNITDELESISPGEKLCHAAIYVTHDNNTEINEVSV